MRLNPERQTAYPLRHDASDPASLGGYDVRALFVDRQGIVWVGHERGVSYWTGAGRPFQLYRVPDGLSDERVNGMHEARDGTVWIATNGGLNRLQPTEGTFRAYYPARQGIARADAVWQVYETRDGTLWVGGKRDGLMRFNRTTERFTAIPGIAEGVRHLREDASGRLWIGTGAGLFIHTPATGETRTVRHDPNDPHSLPNNRVNITYVARDSSRWVGTDDGIARITTAESGMLQFHPLRYDASDPASLGAPVVWTMTETPADPGALWVGTFGGGLCRLDRSTEQFRCLTAAQGLPHNVVYGVLADVEGYLWATTDGGLARIHPLTQAVVVFGTGDGLQGEAFDLMAYHRGHSGQFYVGGPQGFNRFSPADITADDYAPPVLITGIRIFDRERAGFISPTSDTLRIRHNETHLTFDLAALDYVDPGALRYRYRLTRVSTGLIASAENESPAWRLVHGRKPQATYTNLDPGAYVFEAHATNRAGVWSPNQAQLHLIVTPGWWQTWWFQWGGVLGLVGLAAGAVRWRIRHLRTRQMEQVQVQRRLAKERRHERHRIAQDLHDGPMQDLYRMGHDLDHLAEQMPVHRNTVLATRHDLNDVATRLRAVLVALRPPHIAALGLPAALKRLVCITEQRHPGVHLRTDMLDANEAVVDALSGEAQYALYRIAQEALANAIQHANATTISLAVRTTPSNVTLTVTDDGRGFEVPADLFALARDEHFGLLGAAERAEAHGGHLCVTSEPGRGTTVHATVPVASPDAK